jgi:hypothetical protein
MVKQVCVESRVHFFPHLSHVQASTFYTAMWSPLPSMIQGKDSLSLPVIPARAGKYSMN